MTELNILKKNECGIDQPKMINNEDNEDNKDNKDNENNEDKLDKTDKSEYEDNQYSILEDHKLIIGNNLKTCNIFIDCTHAKRLIELLKETIINRIKDIIKWTNDIIKYINKINSLRVNESNDIAKYKYYFNKLYIIIDLYNKYTFHKINLRKFIKFYLGFKIIKALIKQRRLQNSNTKIKDYIAKNEKYLNKFFNNITDNLKKNLFDINTNSLIEKEKRISTCKSGTYDISQNIEGVIKINKELIYINILDIYPKNKSFKIKINSNYKNIFVNQLTKLKLKTKLKFKSKFYFKQLCIVDDIDNIKDNITLVKNCENEIQSFEPQTIPQVVIPEIVTMHP